VKKPNDRVARSGPRGPSIKLGLLAVGLAAFVSASAWAGQPDAVASDNEAASGTTDPDSVARADWSDYMATHPSPDDGCFKASYPSTVWERVPCKMVHPRVHPTPVQRGASG
jgi:hypothetical protein